MVSEEVKDRAGVRQDCWTKACEIKFQRALTASGRETKDWQTVRPTLSRLYTDTNRIYSFPNSFPTRLTYNCAHLRSTKKSLTDSVKKKNWGENFFE